jgi:hypothetical protein
MKYGPEAAPMEERFWNLVYKSPTCWIWLGQRNTNGYGRFFIDRATGQVYAHRVAWAMTGRLVEDWQQIDHLCRRRECVNPNHMEVVTAAVNTRRGRAGAHWAEKRAAA